MWGEVDDDTGRERSFGDDLGRLLDDAMAESGLSEARIADAAGLSKQKVNSWRKGQLPKEPDPLRHLIDAIARLAPKLPVDNTARQQWERRLQAARRSRSRGADTPADRSAPDSAGVTRLRDATHGAAELLIMAPDTGHAATLGVRPALRLPAGSPDDLDSYLPTYVPRNGDQHVERGVRKAVVSGGFVLLVGDEGVGKTRALYEVSVKELSGFPVVVPQPERPDAIEKLCAACGELPRFVLWLDGRERFLRCPDKQAADRLYAWLRSLLDIRVIIVGTIRRQQQEHVDEVRSRGTDTVAGDPAGLVRDAARIVDGLGADHVPVRPISPTEWRTYELAKGDPRLEAARAHSDGRGVAETLTVLSGLERAYEGRRGLTKAIVDALVDLRRIGWHSPVPDSLLREACSSYGHGSCTDAELTIAVAELSGQLERSLIVADEGTSEHGYRLPRYVYSYADQVDPDVRADPSIWDALVAVRASIPLDDLVLLAGAALDRLLLDHALQLYGRAANEGVPYAGEWVAQILARRGQLDLLRELAGTDRCAARWLAAFLAEGGDHAAAATVLRPLFGRTSSVDSVIADLAGWMGKLRACTAGHYLDGLDRMRQRDVIGRVVSGSGPPAVPPLAGAATWVSVDSISSDTGRRRMTAEFRRPVADPATIEPFHLAGLRYATHHLAHVLNERNEPERALDVLRPLVACHDTEAIALASSIRLLVPDRRDRWTVRDRSQVEYHREQAGRADAARRVEKLRELVIGQGFFELAELLAASWEELGAFSAARNLRQFGLTTDCRPAGAPG